MIHRVSGGSAGHGAIWCHHDLEKRLSPHNRGHIWLAHLQQYGSVISQ